MSELDNHSQNSDKFNDSFSYKENKSYLIKYPPTNQAI